MAQDEFAEVARQLEETLAEINQVTDPGVRHTLLSDMRRLIAEADRLNSESASPKKAENSET
jgi:hypothetical protein